MATVQEAMNDDEMPQGIRKSLRAILEMQKQGIEPTGRGVLQHLLEAAGEATSMNMATAALQLWRRERLQDERPEIDRVGLWLTTCSDDALRFVARMVRDEQRARNLRRIKAIDDDGVRLVRQSGRTRTFRTTSEGRKRRA
jgi:uncharacterized protein (UPF0147 family)